MIRKHIKEKFDGGEIQKIQEKYFYEWLINGQIETKSGLFELLEYIESKGIKRAIATGRIRRFAEIILSKTKIMEHFSIIVTGDDYINGKPEPDAFLKASELLQVKPEECLVLEDSNYRN